MALMINTSYLRAYEPLSEFPEDERAQWLSHGKEGEGGDDSASRRWLIGWSLPMGESLTGPAEGAFVRNVGEAILICPWRTRLRMLAGLLAFRSSVPEEVADAFVPERIAQTAARELAMLGEHHPGARSHILHANWHVPLRWFAAFEDSERILTEDSSGLRIRYETSLGRAAERLTRAVEILGDSWIDDTVTEAVRELSEWISGFSGDGLLELDYSSVARMMSPEDLLEDHSAAEVRACLDALAEGDLLTAGRAFATLTEKWSDVRAHEVLN
jgi:hypothetical protein